MDYDDLRAIVHSSGVDVFVHRHGDRGGFRGLRQRAQAQERRHRGASLRRRHVCSAALPELRRRWAECDPAQRSFAGDAAVGG
ncbi:hypothetical protein M0R45_005483 [Rubus argutus]|uniref:Uncharacterized protein n=1 Tax=Rubus argutus TaxID=59490 RepID=A0AAW1YMU3_RUBAR